MSGKSGVGDAVRLNALSNLVPPAAGLLSAPLLARALGVTERGDVAAVTVPILLATSALTFGLPEALTFHTGRGRVTSRNFRVSLLLLCVFGAITGLALWHFSYQLGYSSSVRNALLMVALAIPGAMALAGVRGIAAGMGAWLRIAVERISTSLTRLVLFAILAFTDHMTVSSATLVMVGTTLIGGVAYWNLLADSVWASNSGTTQSMLAYGLRYWPGSLAGALLVRFDQFLMVPLSTSRQLGLYAVAITLYEASLFASNALRDVIFATQSSSPDVHQVVKAARIGGLLTLSIVVLLGGLAIPGIPMIFGAEFIDAVPVLLIMLPAAILGSGASVFAAALSGWDQAGMRSVALIFSAVLNASCVFLLVPSLGAIGAATATVVGTLAAWLFVMAIAWRSHRVRPWEVLLPRQEDFESLTAALLTRPSRK